MRALQQMMPPCCSIHGAGAATCQMAHMPEDWSQLEDEMRMSNTAGKKR
jgi:hypothetical protein